VPTAGLDGPLERCDWRPDGGALALSTAGAGVVLEVGTWTPLAQSPHGYGPFRPDGQALMERRGRGWALIELAGGRELVPSVALRYPYARNGEREHGPVEPLGLCGPELALYSALPTRGRAVLTSIGRGGVARYEHPSIKVADLVAGGYATVLDGDDGLIPASYCPVELPVAYR
jgi:hypothetical protein